MLAVQLMVLKAVIFDFFGTLVENEGTAGWFDELLQRHDCTIDPDIRARWDFNLWDGKEHREASQSEQHYAQWEQNFFQGMFEEAGIPEAKAEKILGAMRRILDSIPFQPYPEALQTLEMLRDRGLALALCSNWNWQLRQHAEGAGVAHLFDATVSSAWVGARKPHPLPFKSVLGDLDIEPEEALFVGDTWRSDIEGAIQVGMPAVHICRQGHDPHGSFDDCPPLSSLTMRTNDLIGVVNFAEELTARAN